MKLNMNCPVSADNTLTAEENPSEASPTVAAMQNSSTEKQAKGKKNSFWAFFRKSRLRVNKVSPLQPMSDTGSADPQPGPSGLEPAALRDQTDSQPGPSSVKPTNCDANPADPEPAEEKQTKKKKKGICQFFKRLWRAVKHPAVHEPVVLQDQTEGPTVLEPMALQDSPDPPEDPQPGSSDHNRDPAASVTPVVGPCGLTLTGLQDPADPLPGPSVPVPRSPRCTGASKRRRVGDQNWFRTTSSPGPSTLPFSEVYEVGEKIGQGGFGTVYEGILKCSRRQVAIKFIPKRVTCDRYISIPGCSKPLLAEVALNLLLNQPPVSPYIVHMRDWFEEKDRYILILQHPQPCKDLERFVDNNRLRMNESLASDLMYQVVLAAKHCSDRGVFHRDIKLNNFLVNSMTVHVKMIDFGCGDLIKSCYFGEFGGGACRPPEYYNGLNYQAEPTTVWSLGDMMYRMLYRCSPFKKISDMNDGTLRFNSRTSRECQDLISRCLSCDPTKRATIQEILQHEWFQRGELSRFIQESGSAI